MSSLSDPIVRPLRALHGEGEFIALMAALMSLNALAIDIMLPALDTLAHYFRIAHPNDRQYVVSAYLVAAGIGSLVFGPLSDRFGRRPVVLTALAGYIILTVGCALAPTFSLLVAGRFVHGLFSAGLFVIATSVVRDRYEGDRMARVMSTIFIVFMIVPVLAPTLGQFILHLGHWRLVFAVLATAALIVFGWTALRLPETLHPEDVIPLDARLLVRKWGTIVTHRTGVGYMFGSGLVMIGLFGFINSAQQVFAGVYGAGEIFPYLFALIALGMALANFLNSRIVERFGARRVGHAALFGLILFSALQLLLAQFAPSLPLFVLTLVFTIGMIGFTGANFGSIAMQPFGHIAGAAASFQAFCRMSLGALGGAWIGHQYDGTAQPLALGFLAAGLLTLALLLFAERGRLFALPRSSRPNVI